MPEADLIAQYDFDEGLGAILHDSSGNGNDGDIKGQNVQWVDRRKGYCLEFNGIDSYVDCGSGSAFGFTDAVTVEAWVLPEGQPSTEVGILGKHYESYFLTFYSDGFCYWYINHGVAGVANYAKAELPWGVWHHVAATYSSATLRLELYVDGELRSAPDLNPGSPPKIQPGQSFLIGFNHSLSGFFQGLIDNVKVYSRALAANEVRDRFQAGEKDLEYQEYRPFQPLQNVQAGAVSVSAGASGQIRVDTGSDSLILETMFSYPRLPIGWNHLTTSKRKSEPAWVVSTNKTPPATLAIEAAGQFYRVNRRLSIQGDKIQVEDRLLNLQPVPRGLVIWNRLTASVPIASSLVPGFAENPTMHLPIGDSVLGLSVEDDLARLHFDPSSGLPANQARFWLSDIALDGGKDYTIRWTLYILSKNADYFDVINRVRQDWGANFRIEGPFAFFDANPLANPLLNDAGALAAYFQRKHLKIVALNPWLDYDPGSFDHVLSRADYKALMQAAIPKIKAADPGIRCLGSIETDWVAIDLDQLDPQNKIPRLNASNQLTLNSDQTKIIDDANLPWKESAKRDPAGNLTLEYYQRGNPLKPQWSLAVYPAIGNYQHAFLMDQAKFLLAEVGMDGFYVDQFSQNGIRTYQAWDGWSVDINNQTGEIAARYTDCSLAGIGARVQLCSYALAGGRTVVANTWATSAAEQALPANRFAETWGFFDPNGTDISDFPDGTEPAAASEIFRGNLGSPIGLGTQPKPAVPVAKRLMKAVIAYLRHGMLYYHYHIEDIPPGQGEYGPVNHMFPITPVALHKGWIEGKERIITAVSGKYHWPYSAAPKVHCFNIMGQEIAAPGITTSKTVNGWQVKVKMPDWAQIVVIE
jgi:hypothetical protein